MDPGYLLSLIQTVLQYSGIRQKQKDIYRILCSDERYPSALSIIKTLAYWGVSASAYQADLGNIKKETGLKIVHLNVNGGRFFIVKEIGEHEIILVDTVKRTLPLDAFVEMWDGIEHECKKVQALANAYIKDGASADAWDKWADDFVKHC